MSLPRDTRPTRKVPLTEQELAGVATLWSEKAAPVKLLGAWENFVFSLEDGRQRVVLRVTECSRRSRAEVEEELDFMEHLALNGVRVPAIVRTQAEGRSGTISTGVGTYVFCFFEYLAGDPVLAETVKTETLGVERWGGMIASIHNSSSTFRLHGRRKSWYENELLGADRSVLPPGSRELIQATLASLKTRDRTRGYGLIHADIHGRNVLRHGLDTAVIDFDDGCYHWYMYDLGVALNWLTLANSSPAELDKVSCRLLAGYARIRATSSGDDCLILELAHLRCVLDYLLAISRIAQGVDPIALRQRCTKLEAQLEALTLQIHRSARKPITL